MNVGITFPRILTNISTQTAPDNMKGSFMTSRSHLSAEIHDDIHTLANLRSIIGKKTMREETQQHSSMPN